MKIMAAQAGRHIQELQRLSASQQMTTKVPPAYDGRSSWFAYEDAIDDWVDITELEPEKQGPALRNRLEGEAAIHKRLLDREKLKDKVNGVQYFKSYLRPLFVKGASNVPLPAVYDLAPWQWRHAPVDYQIPTLESEKAGSLGGHRCADHRCQQSRSSSVC